MSLTLRKQLQKMPLFAHVDPVALGALADSMTAQTFAPEQWIVRENEPGDSLYIMTTGIVSVFKSGGGVMMELLDLLRPGDMFGEMSLFLNEPRSASVQAVLPTTCAVLRYADFEAFVAQHSHAGQQIYRQCIALLAERLQASTNRRDPLQAAEAMRIDAAETDAPATLPEAFAERLALIRGMGELLATAPLTMQEQTRCRAVLQEQLSALQQAL